MRDFTIIGPLYRGFRYKRTARIRQQTAEPQVERAKVIIFN